MIKRIHDLHAVFTSEELGRLHQRMAESGVRNRSSFIDLDEISEMIRLLRISSNNLNQIAKKANATGSIYGADIAALQARQDEIWEITKEILAKLSTIQ